MNNAKAASSLGFWKTNGANAIQINNYKRQVDSPTVIFPV